MITTVTMNAAIDKTYVTSQFQPNQLYRIQNMHACAGGKGINVARVIRTLKEDVTASGIVAGYNGMFIQEQLFQEGINHDFISVDGESRICLNVIDPLSGTQTELLEQGPVLNESTQEAMKTKISMLARRSSHVILSGSLPQGCHPTFYANCIKLIQDAGAVPVLDASGDALLAGVEAKPLLIKPNEHEVLRLTGGTTADEHSLIEAIARLMEQGVLNVVVSLGGQGAIAGLNHRIYRVTIPKVDVVNTVGCGDSMLAGIVVADKRGLPPIDQLRMGAACGTANALMPAAGLVRLEDIGSLMKQVEVTLIEG
ncbi:1-phosphofructokinase [Paenibacillus sp. UMB4589-SE434]|uniref:1-phosphofructokinase n=1 Tax=Paenibacillus sp. UMB4589-SE434 TaxID=3046314 RepID=UPI00254D0A0F|nr:1-phosphofructokinase [Paenibacillus sp. UMB4589-SE434]MDK8182697.1 1-phosphofructokinase [Paenibacillus sp. UMB4589-SE434]